MYTSPKTLTLAFVAAATVAASAHAEPHKDRFPISLAEMEAKAEQRFNQTDVDGSGTIDLAEFENAKMPPRGHGGHKKHRASADADGQKRDGRHGRGKRKEMRAAVKAEIFAIKDTNNDGSISKEEDNAADSAAIKKLAMKRAMFNRLDKDQNQLLSAQEMPNPAKFLRLADEDNDGYVSHDEMRANRHAIRRARHGS